VEPLARRALEIREKVLGPNHPDVALSLNTLAELYRKGPDPTQAEPLYLRALAIIEKTLDPKNKVGDKIRHNYIFFLRSQGRDAEANALEARSKTTASGAGATKAPGK
jgi:hypothetical protein